MALTTELEAVNRMLLGLAMPAVNSLTGTLNADASDALTLLREVKKSVLEVGWNFNSEEKVTFSPSATLKTISLDGDVLQIDVTQGYNTDVEVVQRGSKLYDKKNHTWRFDSDLTCDVVYDLDWDELPEAARRYIMIRATRIFADNIDGGEAHHAYKAQDELAALNALNSAEAKSRDLNFFRTGLNGRFSRRTSVIDYM